MTYNVLMGRHVKPYSLTHSAVEPQSAELTKKLDWTRGNSHIIDIETRLH